MIKAVRQWLVVCASSMLLAGSAAAVPVTFQLDNVVTVGAAFAATQTYTPGFSITGTGDIDVGAGTGSLFLSDYSITIDVFIDLVFDARIDVTGWSQTITAIDGSGNVTSTGGGASACTVLGGIGGAVCPSVPPTVAGWPAPGGAISAVIDSNLQTITVVDTSNALAGTITQYYSYFIVPEPGAALLVGGGLLGLGVAGRAKRLRRD